MAKIEVTVYFNVTASKNLLMVGMGDLQSRLKRSRPFDLIFSAELVLNEK